MFLRTTLLVFSAFTALATVAACKEQPPVAAATVTKAAPAAAEPAKTPPMTPPPAAASTPDKVDAAEKLDAPPPADGKIGVAECDEYIEKYTQCIMERMPDKAKGYMKDAIEQAGKAWREAASGPSKDGVAAVCKVALEAAKQATTSLGCQW